MIQATTALKTSRAALLRRPDSVVLLLAVLLFALLGCSQANEEKFKSYVVGFSTPNVKVWVSAAYLDQKVGILGGSIKGAWEEAGATNHVDDAPMPREIYVNWQEVESGKQYEATVKLVDDLAKRARALPPFRHPDPEVEESGKRLGGPGYNRGIYLIIGLAPEGKVTVWLSNHSYKYVLGRVLEIVGEAQGTATTEVAPYYPKRPALEDQRI